MKTTSTTVAALGSSCLILAVATVVMSLPAQADTASLSSAKDNTLYEEKDGKFSNGAGQYLFAGNTKQGNEENTRRALIQFNLAAVPTNATVTNVTLTLYMSRTIDGSPRTHTVHRVSASWGEGTSDAPDEEGKGADPPAPGDATWLHRFYDTNFWVQQGGDFNPTHSGSTSIGTANGYYTWSSTPAMVADVQEWVTNDASNFGWLIRGAEGNLTETARQFHSREGSNRPELQVDYSTPDPTPPDTNGPVVTITQPSGDEVFLANQSTNITWTATDPSGVDAFVDIFHSLDGGVSWMPLAFSELNDGSFDWIPPNRPSSNCLIRVDAMDGIGNPGSGQSAASFSVVSPDPTGAPTTLRDFDLPGSQPLELTSSLANPQTCASCHGNFDTNSEPWFNWQGSMMAHAGRDPLFEANLVIANQDAAESGDLCLRCHKHTGWAQGRSVPTDGSSMVPSDGVGVSCDLCHRLVDPIYEPGVSPPQDLDILAAMINPGTNFASAMLHLDPQSARRGPFSNSAAPHQFTFSPFHREAALCGSCHDVSNPAYERDGAGVYQLNALDTPPVNMSPHKAGVVERTYSEWLASDFNTPQGVYLPEFAGNKTNGFVATCQDCHMRDVAGYGCDTNQYPATPLRQDMPLHDMTGHSTWLPLMIANLHSNEVNAAAITAGVARATYILQNAADMVLKDAANQLQVSITNNCGHKLPTGYPEGRRMWINVKFLDQYDALVGESGAYDTNTGVLSHDAEAKIYEVHPGIDTNVAGIFGLPAGPSLHFVLNNKTFDDNRIPPRGFSNAAFDAFGGAPVGYSYADGQYWDDTLYTVPAGAVKAEVKLYFQSTSKEFVEFLYTNNVTNAKGQELYDLWNNNGKCPPTTMQEAVWQTPLTMESFGMTAGGEFEMVFHCRPGHNYAVEHTDSLSPPVWQSVAHVPTNTPTVYVDNTSSPTGMRFYRVRYDGAP